MEGIVHLHGRRPTACADAFDFFQRKQAVGRYAFVGYAKLGFAVVENLFSTRNKHAMFVQT
jgi:hypothetical protein